MTLGMLFVALVALAPISVRWAERAEADEWSRRLGGK